MTQTDLLIACSDCERPVRESAAQDLGWRFYSDGLGELRPFCALCARRGARPVVPLPDPHELA